MNATKATTATTPRSRAKVQQIRDAARRLFLKHGFEGASVDAIAAAAEVSKHTLYRYYASKEALFADIVYEMTLGRSLAGEQTIPEAAIASTAGLEAYLLQIATRLLDHDFDPAYLALFRMVVAEAPRFPQLAAQYRAVIVDQGMRYLSTLLTRAGENGIVTVAEIDLTVRLFIGALRLYISEEGLLATTTTPVRPTPEEVAALVHLFVTLIT